MSNLATMMAYLSHADYLTSLSIIKGSKQSMNKLKISGDSGQPYKTPASTGNGPDNDPLITT